MFHKIIYKKCVIIVYVSPSACLFVSVFVCLVWCNRDTLANIYTIKKTTRRSLVFCEQKTGDVSPPIE